MPFGIKNAPADFQRLMELVLTGLNWIKCLVYIDDIIIFSATFEEHLKALEDVFKALKTANLKVKPEKCQFLQSQVLFLGHLVSSQGIRPDPAKIQDLLDFPPPTSVKGVQQFLGLVQWFKKFIPNLAKTATPLYRLLRKDTPFDWTVAHQTAFEFQTPADRAGSPKCRLGRGGKVAFECANGLNPLCNNNR